LGSVTLFAISAIFSFQLPAPSDRSYPRFFFWFIFSPQRLGALFIPSPIGLGHRRELRPFSPGGAFFQAFDFFSLVPPVPPGGSGLVCFSANAFILDSREMVAS